MQSPSLPKYLGKYRLERKLGRGGMGSVWAAYDDRLKRQVAIKLMEQVDSSAEDRQERFAREAQVIARLQNPHVVQVYDYGLTAGGMPYIVMELLEGEDLASRLTRTRPLPLVAFVPVLTQVAKALEAAHKAGVVHRDLKPANIYLARQGAEVVAKILDFGVASICPQQFGSRLDLTGDDQLVGTPQYMSPEQLRSKKVDYRTDLWSLGVVAYEVLTGRVPFHAEAFTEVLARIHMDIPERPSSVNPELDEDVDEFFERALAKEPTARFSSAMEMAAAFAALDHRQVSNKPAKILVVDDEPDLALLMRTRFRRQIRRKQYEFLFAGDGREALETLRNHPDVDIALTDINMPGMDGLTFLSHVGKVSPTLKSVVITAYNDMNNIRRAMNYGAFDFLVKPIDFQDLEATLGKAVREVRKLRKALRSIEENDALRMFVDPAVIERLLPRLRVASGMTGETIHATVVFVDIHGFRDYSRTASAEHAIERLNRNFDVVIPVLNAWKGSVIRFMGDAVMAVFQGEEHLLKALGACTKIRTQLVRLAAETGADSPYAHGVCIGIGSGAVIAGSVGSPSTQRLDYAVLGDVVSDAIKLGEAAVKNQILIAEPLVEGIAAMVSCEPVDRTIQNAANQIVSVYNVTSLQDDAMLNGIDDGTALARTIAVDKTDSDNEVSG